MTIIVAALVVIAVILAFTLLVPKSSGSAPSAGPSASPSLSPRPSTPSVPGDQGSATTAPVDPIYGAPVAETVPKDEHADFGDKVTANITALTEVTATGTLPGEVSGPAVQVDMEITNGTTSEISLSTVTVNAYYGPDKTPASPYTQTADEKFPETLATGGSATARYVFRVPKDAVDSVVVTVSRSAGEPIVVFQ